MPLPLRWSKRRDAARLSRDPVATGVSVRFARGSKPRGSPRGREGRGVPAPRTCRIGEATRRAGSAPPEPSGEDGAIGLPKPEPSPTQRGSPFELLTSKTVGYAFAIHFALSSSSPQALLELRLMRHVTEPAAQRGKPRAPFPQ